MQYHLFRKAAIVLGAVALVPASLMHFWSTDEGSPSPAASPTSNADPALLQVSMLAQDRGDEGDEDYPTAEEAAENMETIEGLEFDLLLSEPSVEQPVFLNFDERGRMWVVQYRQYPNPAGLTLMSRDRYWRNVYDQVPPAPPNHFPGLDKITIHEDTNADGVFDEQKVFVEGLSIVTSLAHGRGGVWVLNPPYLLFYPDADRDDVPDGDPVVHLEGFGIEDTHSVVNSIRWGNDGWLYGAQGSTVSASITRPGIENDEPMQSIGQLIWRYHPETRRYEVFAEGGGNTFGVEIDSQGRVFSGTNQGDARGYHYVQGAYYRKKFSKHGELSNPYVFDHILHMPHHNARRFTHNFLIYDHGALPDEYTGQIFGVHPISSVVIRSEITADGSTFRTRDIDRAVNGDNWFRPVDIKVGPDGAVYIADWHDRQTNHYRNHEGRITPTSGRIWRMRGEDPTYVGSFDLGTASTEELIEALGHENRWWRQTAQRIIADRNDAGSIDTFRELMLNSEGQLALEALWALSNSGGLDEAVALQAMDHENPFVRFWAIRLMCDDFEVGDAIAAKMEAMAIDEPNAEVRCVLACSARRLPAEQCLPVIRHLLTHEEDIEDLYIRKVLWWAVESKCGEAHDQVLAMFEDEALWSEPIVTDYVAERLMRRWGTSATRRDLIACGSLLNSAPDSQLNTLMRGFEEAARGRSLGALPRPLVEAMARTNGGSLAIQVRLGDEEAIREAIEQMSSDETDIDSRIGFVNLFGEIKTEGALPSLLQFVEQRRERDLRQAAIAALTIYDGDQVVQTVLAAYSGMNDAQREVAQTLLISRPAWGAAMLEAVQAGSIEQELIPIDVIHRLLFHNDDHIAELVEATWGDLGGATDAEKRAEMARLLEIVDTGEANPYRGQSIFNETCGKCHQLFNRGGDIGPDLTPYQRDDIQNVLLSVVNPSAEIREGYENFVVYTDDGLVLNGFVADQDNQVVMLRCPDGQTVAIPRDSIEEMQAVGRSVMPDGLLDELDDQQIRDLMAYLRSGQPLGNNR